MKETAHKAFDAVLTDDERASPLDERIVAAVRAMAREVGLSSDDPAVAVAVEREMNGPALAVSRRMRSDPAWSVTHSAGRE